ncbi:ABC transporter ATP-binding protein [Roseivirga sp.]|uniref:ABC transporter ATP-binding protein n=1 Tax=Roseivirga sp. TaxID=1964215 RepID=UPI002B276DE7|nr:ABC transporter ATP-binding protein [Roseivirga sp.]
MNFFRSDIVGYFLYFYKQLKYRVFVVIVLSIIVGALDGLGLAMFLPLLQMVNKGSSAESQDLGQLDFIPRGMDQLGLPFELISVLSLLCIFFILKGTAKYFSGLYNVNIQQFYVKKIRLGLLSGVKSMFFKSYMTTDMGRIQNTLTGEVGRVMVAYTAYFSALQNLVLMLVYVSFAIFIDIKFSFLVVIGALLTNILYRKIYKLTRGSSHRVTSLSHDFEGFLIQFVQNFKYLKATGLLNKYEKRLSGSIVNIEKENRKIGTLNALLIAVKEPILIVVVSSAILIQTMVFEESLAPILISLLFFYRSLGTLIAVQNDWNKFIARIGSLENLIEFQETLSTSKENDGDVSLVSFKKEIILNGLNFSFDDQQVLRDVNLTIRAKETVAFVGESGAGKTTLINVVSGLMPVGKGELTYDGIDSSVLEKSSLQKRIGYITQEPVIFSDSIFNNVTFWEERNSDTLKRFELAVRKAAMEEFMEPLAEGLDTKLGDNGINLSGGQKQRLSIARELYKEIDLLILDEATSALDSETENSIKRNIEDLKGTLTILVVAHRLSTIRNADRIVLMDKGKIERVGDFDTLKRESSRFKRMVELQEF